MGDGRFLPRGWEAGTDEDQPGTIDRLRFVPVAAEAWAGAASWRSLAPRGLWRAKPEGLVGEARRLLGEARGVAGCGIP